MTSALEQELASQPDVLAALVDRAPDVVAALRSHLGGRRFGHAVIAARGSSDNVARYAKYVLGLRNRLSVALAAPSLPGIYGVVPRWDDALVIGVSQSGQSPDVVGVVEAATDRGHPAIALTNDPSSPLARAATMVVDIGAGEERAVAATKTYTASLLGMALVSIALDDASGAMSPWSELAAVPAALAATVRAQPDTVPGWLVKGQHLVVAGRGLNHCTALESALKVRELTGIRAEGFSPPDLLHGPIAAVGPGSAALLIGPAEPGIAGLWPLLDPLRSTGARLVAATGEPELVEAVDHVLPLVAQPAPWLTPMTAVVAGQVLAMRLAAERGRDLDQPPGLQKVTRTH